ncbi:hypothetical protein HDU67_004329, partial [Dinochytrium kinnereticum]
MFLQALQKNDFQTAKAFLQSLDSNERLTQSTPPAKDGFGRRHVRASDLNKRDASGNAPIHIAAAMQDQELLELLLRLPAVDSNLQDEENGYSILHKALYLGNIRLALTAMRNRPDMNLQLRDREGNTCFDLLNLSLDQFKTFHDSHMQKGGRTSNEFDELLQDDDPMEDRDLGSETALSLETDITSIWTWGKNSNYALGSQNSDDRILPERIDTDFEHRETQTISSMSTPRPFIVAMALSKYHMVFSTNSGKVYSNGFGPGGRLGLGHENTVVKPALVQGISGHIVSIALGPDHSVAISVEGVVWTWGSNKFGQLGFTTDLKNGELMPRLAPEEVDGPLKKIRIIGGTASKYHTAVFSDTGLIFTWGYNAGQL